MLPGLLDGIEALAALEQLGTVSEAAVRLRLTQSAVSKRLAVLQRAVGFAVVEPTGRRLRLTAGAMSLLERARPILADLRGLASPLEVAGGTSFSLAIAESIAASWGPAVVAQALAQTRETVVEVHAHRSVLVIESVRLGRYHIGLSTGAGRVADLIQHPVTAEPMVLVHSGLGAKPAMRTPLLIIEPQAATWRAIEPLLGRTLLERDRVVVESFSAALQMVKAGFGDGILPLGLALEAGLPRRSYHRLAGVTRPVSLFTRKTVYQLASFERLRDAIIEEARRYFRTPAGYRGCAADPPYSRRKRSRPPGRP